MIHLGGNMKNKGTLLTLEYFLRENDTWMIEINYFDKRERLIRREIETKSPKLNVTHVEHGKKLTHPKTQNV